MKRSYFILGLILLIAAQHSNCMKQERGEQGKQVKKKILILTSSEGGNLVASQAIESYLDADYEVIQCPVFKEILAPIDPFNVLTFNNYCGEDFYKSLVPGKHFQLLGWVYQCGNWYMQSRKESISRLLRDYFIKTKPDLIISVIPVINNIILDVAQELNVPFLLMPTDLDSNPYITGITHPTYEKFYVGLIFDNPAIKMPLEKAFISSEHIRIFGAPIRKDFLEVKDKKLLRQRYGINNNVPVIMLLMGSLGAQEIKDYTAELLKIKHAFHLFVCIGKNEQSKQDLLQLSVPPHIQMTIVGFTNTIADYMAVSDILITKSGTLSVCESLYLNLPLFLDATSTLLPWEEFNHFFIKKYNFGTSLKNYNQVTALITDVLNSENKLQNYQKNIQKLHKKNCSHELKKFINNILFK